MSGSPRVLVESIRTLTKRGRRAQLLLGSGGDGPLGKLSIPISRYWYRRGSNRLLTFASYLLSQMSLLLKLATSRGIEKDAIIYINTLLPFAAAIFGRMTSRRVIYHVHEVSIEPRALRAALICIANLTASKAIYVSRDQARRLPLRSAPISIVHNAVREEFYDSGIAHRYAHRPGGQFRVLLLASPRDYKGIPEFFRLAHDLMSDPTFEFVFAANDDRLRINEYIRKRKPPPNVTVHASVSDTRTLYAQASLVLNLSRPDMWIETFGLTILEAMTFGVPVIAPPLGGPAEIVTHGREGFLIDCRDHALLREHVLKLAQDKALSEHLSGNARQTAARYSPHAYRTAIVEAVEGAPT